MNAKSIKKRLMRSRLETFFGYRAMFGVKIKTSHLVVKPPVFPKPLDGWRPAFEDNFWTFHYENNDFVIHIAEVSTCYEEDGIGIITLDKRPDYDEIELRNGFKRYDITYAEKRIKMPPETLETGERVKFTPEEIEWVQKLYECYKYDRNFLTLQDKLGEIIDYPHSYGPAKACYVDLDNDYAYMTYTVRWKDPDTKRRFCSHMAWTLRQLDKMGIEYGVK